MGADVLQPRTGQRGAAATVDLTVPVLLLADDLAFVAPTAEQLQRFMAAFESACHRWGLVLSAPKIQLMLVGGAAALACEGCQQQQPERDMVVCDRCQRGWHRGCLRPPLATIPSGDWHCPTCAAGGAGQDAWRPPVAAGGQQLQWVDSFKYLGSYFSGDSSLQVELDTRVRLAAHAFRQLERAVFRQRCIPLRVRVQVYNCMVASVLLYGSESWALNAAQLQRLEVFHTCRLRMMLGAAAARRRAPGAGWQRISNDELLARCRSPPIATHLARRQLRWLGHLGRMGDERLVKQMLHATMHRPGRSRRLGRPRRDLCATYADAIARYMTPAALRARDKEVPRGSTWLSLCRNRDEYRHLCP